MFKKIVILVALLALFSASKAVADIDAGVNIDWSKPEGIDNGDWGIGARMDLGGQIRVMFAFDYYFTNADDLFDEGTVNSDDFDLQFWELNGNLIYEFPTAPVHPYFGGGIGLARRTFDDVEDVFDDRRNQFGVNVLGGMKFGHAAVEPFIELRYTFYPDAEDRIFGDIVDPLDINDRVRFRDRFIVSGGIVF